MVAIDSGVAFDSPTSWESFIEGGRYLFHTPLREEIIISARKLDGEGSPNERAQLLDQIFENALEAARRGAAVPGLRIIKPLAEDSMACALRCATILAETAARDAFFGQAVMQYSHGTIFLTYEAPFVEGADKTFCDLLKRVRKV